MSNVLQHCTDVQTSVNCFHKTCTGGKFIHWSTGLHSTYHFTHLYTETCPITVKTSNFVSITCGWDNLGSRGIQLMPPDGKALAFFSMQLIDGISLKLEGSFGKYANNQTPARKCQRYPQKRMSTVSMIWQIISAFWNHYLSLFDENIGNIQHFLPLKVA